MSDIISRARDVATKAHGDQQYGSGKPYSVHLEAVVNILREFGFENNEDLLVAAWLHDVIEDTYLRAESLIISGFSPYAVALVDAVTDRPGKNRAERHVLTYPRIARIPDAVTLKLADRLANVRASVEHRPDLLKMYASEHPEFIAAMPLRPSDEGMRQELRSLLKVATL